MSLNAILPAVDRAALGIVEPRLKGSGQHLRAPYALSPPGPADLPHLWTIGLPTGACTTLQVAHRVHRPRSPLLLAPSSLTSSPAR